MDDFGEFEMKLDRVGHVIERRELRLIRDGGDPVEVVVLTGKPQTLRDRTDSDRRLVWDADEEGDIGFPSSDSTER